MLEPQYREVHGRKVAFLREGKGEPLILVHGVTTYSFIWRELIPTLSEDFDVVAVDLMGCGYSEKPLEADYSIKAQAEFITGLVDELGFEGGVHFAGHDIGGGIGQILAVSHPGRLRSLVLINTVGYDYWPVQPVKVLRVPFIRDVVFATFNLGFFKMLIRQGVHRKEAITDEVMDFFWAPLREKDGKHGFLQLAKYLNNRHLTEIAGGLRELDLPVLIIRGDNDIYLSPEISRRLHDDIKGSRLVRIENGGHFIQLDEPVVVAWHIKKFITGVTGRN